MNCTRNITKHILHKMDTKMKLIDTDRLTNQLATPPFVIHIFDPFMTHYKRWMTRA
jgi:hypothetical protein